MTTTIVIPCFNEDDRLIVSSVGTLLEDEGVRLVLVNDGSTDSTWARLNSLLQSYPSRIELLNLLDNVGKGEAVRRGMRTAIANQSLEVGYLDADFATPASEMLRLISVLRAMPASKVVMGARWLHLGARIKRSTIRHYAGRIFATLASNVLRMPIYDTQCGAKVFRVTDRLTRALETPFVSRWIFDVELIARLIQSADGATNADKPYENEDFLEIPLDQWTDVRGSKLRLIDALRAGFEVIALWRRYAR